MSSGETDKYYTMLKFAEEEKVNPFDGWHPFELVDFKIPAGP